MSMLQPRKTWQRRSIILFVLLLVLLLILAGLAISSLNLFSNGSTSHSPSTTVGHVTFLNSGQLDAQNSQGVDDEIQINLQNISAPSPGKSYYAWLKNSPFMGEGTWVLVGTLQVNQGNAQLPSLYQDPQHADLLINASSFLVTEEATNIPPAQPSTDQSLWRFASQPALTPLTHLRHLLANSPELQVRQLYGGLAIWLWRNTEKLVEWSSSARDDAQQNNPQATDQTHRQLIRILDYIDGADSASTDVPPGTPLLVDAHDNQVPLVGPPVTLGPPGDLYNGNGEKVPGYVYLLRIHLDAATESPQATPEQRQIATQIANTLNQVKLNLDQVRKDASQLVGLDDTQLVTPQSLSTLNDLVTQVENAYIGSMSPDQGQGGAFGIYKNIQNMARFEVQPYTAH